MKLPKHFYHGPPRGAMGDLWIKRPPRDYLRGGYYGEEMKNEGIKWRSHLLYGNTNNSILKI